MILLILSKKLSNYFARGGGCEVLWWVCLCVCLSVCLSVRENISGTTCAIFTKFLCMLPMSVARSSSATLMIGRIAYWQEGGDGNTQRRRSVIYDWLPCISCIDVALALQPSMLILLFYNVFMSMNGGLTCWCRQAVNTSLARPLIIRGSANNSYQL